MPYIKKGTYSFEDRCAIDMEIVDITLVFEKGYVIFTKPTTSCKREKFKVPVRLFEKFMAELQAIYDLHKDRA